MSQVGVSSHSLPPSVAERLLDLRRRLQTWFLVDGLGRLLLAAAALAGLSLLLDRAFQFEWTTRLALLALGAAALLGLAWWRLARPLGAAPSDDALCLEVEHRHRQLGERLISAVQFARMDDDFESKGVSPALVKAAIAEGDAAARQVRFGDALHAGRHRQNVALLGLGLALAAGLGVGVALNDTLRVWFQRNVLLANTPWPQRANLVVLRAENGRVKFPRGDNWKQLVEARADSQAVPDKVWLDFRPRRPPQLMKKSGALYEHEFRGVYEEFQFRARADDGWLAPSRTPWISVVLVDQPEASEVRLEVTPPRFAGGGVEPLPAGRGPHYVLRGSALRITGEATKPLSRGELAIVGQDASGGESRDPQSRHVVPLEIIGERRFVVNLPADPPRFGLYQIRLTDTEGLSSKRPAAFALREKIDRPPRVLAQLVGVNRLVTAKARVPFTCRASDEFGVSALRIKYHWRGEAEGAEKADAHPFPEIAGLPRPEVEHKDFWMLQPLGVPVNSSLTFTFEADDNNDVLGGSRAGSSSEFLLRVVSEEELRADLLRREKERRQEFEGLLDIQEDLLTDTRALAADAREQPQLEKNLLETLRRLQRGQKLVGVNTSSLAEKFEEILIEVQNNFLEEEGGPLQKRLISKIIDPMLDLAENGVGQALQGLDRARRLADSPAERGPALEAAIVQQEKNVALMKEILLHMVKAEGFQEAVNLLYEIEKSQKGVFDMTLKEKQERIRRLLEQGGDAPKENPPR